MHIKPGTKVSLKDYDPADTGPYESEHHAAKALASQLAELRKLQYLMYAENRRALLVVLQGVDAAGKDGTIRHVVSGMNPLGVQVHAFKEPSTEELARDFLWRVHQRAPNRGVTGIFNRSHYEDVVVVRVHELVPRKVWKKRYEQINQFEKMLVENGTIVLKFFLHISKGEQKKRLQERLIDPSRQWKLSLADVEERNYWMDYRKAYETVLTRCNTHWAPWHIVSANHKWYRNLVVAETIVNTLQSLDMKYPQSTLDLSKIVIK